jgi:hypothetical protein
VRLAIIRRTVACVASSSRKSSPASSPPCRATRASTVHCPRRLPGQSLHRGGDDGEALAHLAGPRDLDRRIERQEVGLARDLIDEPSLRAEIVGREMPHLEASAQDPLSEQERDGSGEVMATKKVCAHRSSRMAMRRQSLSFPNMVSMRWRWRWSAVSCAMGFCTQADYLAFTHQTPELERMLSRTGLTHYKYGFSVTHEEQARRFVAQETDPLKQGKLSPIDKASRDTWHDCTEAKEAMFFCTDTADAPWTMVKSNEMRRARLEAMRHFLHTLPCDDKDTSVVHEPDPLIVGNAAHVLGTTLHPAARRVRT